MRALRRTSLARGITSRSCIGTILLRISVAVDSINHQCHHRLVHGATTDRTWAMASLLTGIKTAGGASQAIWDLHLRLPTDDPRVKAANCLLTCWLAPQIRLLRAEHLHRADRPLKLQPVQRETHCLSLQRSRTRPLLQLLRSYRLRLLQHLQSNWRMCART